MCPIKLCIKPIFQIFHILKINRIMPFCNLFMERRSYIIGVSTLFHFITSHLQLTLMHLNNYMALKFTIMVTFAS